MSENKVRKRKILVLGTNGKTGSRVRRQLAALGWPTQIGSRSANPISNSCFSDNFN